MNNIDFKKGNGLVPAIIQDDTTLQVLMLGFMNYEAYTKTVAEGRVTFFSRTKNRLWTKGETSGNFLFVKEIIEDCDHDTLLLKVNLVGPVCHTGNVSCFGKSQEKGFLYRLEDIIDQRIVEGSEKSYTLQLFEKGVKRVAQKVGEEATELIIEAIDDQPEQFKNETADLLYHLLVLLRVKSMKLSDIEKVLGERHKMKR